ncbi:MULTISPECIES: orotate phosphoribosyltransferase [Prochlorococcus]|uniref:Orotate phosphoribosyltransferase n=1 Tax=Prochlorococcus marinus str. MIT 9116 TaxID=167544 RepID=A0A0A1ZNQ9_PROMR|nr:orotate phosphoribosyltransferase [Prochlorococcus marinus]KGF89132.1 Orotate phosphoribosyltransferase [Prochlorococcus marinus str. MIT 9107]KGF89889.1 Orotate phosphoribosyltransferase [Prochlorococcus marinus str. MIT 9116]KGF95219.1 Orotate phosphoribosyltransferase [Prochlorococcus marinus str. MIT 9123]
MGNFSEKYDLNKAKLLKQLIDKSYKKGNFTLASGKKSSHYLNCKPVSLNGEGLNLISDLFLELKDSRSKAVAGLTLGADPLVSGLIVTAASQGIDLNGLIIRKEIKSYGTKAGIEGPNLERGTLVTVLEDVVTTAGSVIKAIKKLRENNYVVKEVLSIVDRKEGGYEALDNENVNLKSLFTIKDFL